MRIVLAVLVLLVLLAVPLLLWARSVARRDERVPQVWAPKQEPQVGVGGGEVAGQADRRPDGRPIPGSRAHRRAHGKP